MHLRPLIASLLLCALLAGAAAGDSDDLAFAKALHQRGFDDLATAQLERMKRSRYLSPDEKAEASLGLADLYESLAAQQTTPTDKEALLAKATAELASFLKAHPKHPKANESRFKRAQLLVERGNALAQTVEMTPDKKQRAALIKKAEAIYAEARREAEKAAAAFEKLAGPSRSRIRRRRRRKLSPQDIARARMLDARLMGPEITFFSAALYKGTPKYVSLLNKARAEFEAFAKKYKGTDRTLRAYRYEGLCWLRQKQYDKALKCFRQVIGTRPIPETAEIRQLTYLSQAECYNAARRYEDAVKTVSVMLGREWPDLLKEKAPVALAARLEQAKALVAMALRARGQAASYRKQKRTAEAKKAEATAKRRLDGAISNAREVAAAGGVWGNTARDLLAKWSKLAGKKVKRTAEQALIEAVTLYNAKKFKECIGPLREAVRLAQLPKDKGLVVQAWMRMGAAYFNLQRPYEAALCFGYAPRKLGADAVKADVAYYHVQLMAQLYQQHKSKYSGRRYLEALQFFGRTYPKDPRAATMQFMAAEIARDQGEYADAAIDYALIPPSNEHYEEAAYLAGVCNWLECLKLYEKNRDKALAFARKAEKALAGFLKWARELPKIEPARVGKGEPWVAKAEVDLAEIYVHPAIKKPERALAVLKDFSRRHPKHRDLLARVEYARLRADRQLGRMADAEAAFARMAKADPKFPHLSMAARLIAQGYFEQWEQAKKAKLAKAEVRRRGDKAAAFLLKILAANPSQPLNDYVWIGASLYKLGRFKEAADVFNKAIARYEPKLGAASDEMVSVRRSLAECYLALKDFGRALKLVQEMVKREPKVVDYRKDLATCYEKSGLPQQALKEWLRVIRLVNQGDADWHLAKAKIILLYLAMKQPEKAFQRLVLQREMYPDWGKSVSPEAAALYQSAIEKLPPDFKKKFKALEAEAAAQQ